MDLVIIESPYAGDIEENTRYAIQCMRDCLQRGEAPFASHLLYTQCLDDSIPKERELGITAGLFWAKQATRTVVYTDRGISEGMKWGIMHASDSGRRIEFRTLKDYKDETDV